MTTIDGCLSCTKCTTLICHPVPPQVGSKRVVFIGEAPGREEDIERKPFVGGAGKTLNSIFHMAGLYRSDYSITNIIRCRPPNNREPLPDEISNCLEHLINELTLLKPEFIVALGNTASMILTGQPIAWRGSILPCQIYNKVPTLITWHPAYVMRNREEFSTLVHDLQKINVDNRPANYVPNYRINPTIQQAQAVISTWDCPISVDIETTGEEKDDGLNPWRGEIMGIAFGGPPGEAIHFGLRGPKVVSPFSERWEFIRDLLQDPHRSFIYQNNTFDRCFLWINGIPTPTPIWDTMDAMHVIYSAAPKTLDYLRSLYTNMAPYKVTYKKRGLSLLTENDLATYNCKDVDVTSQTAIQQARYMDSIQQRNLRELLDQGTLAVEMRIRGVYIDKEELAKNYLAYNPASEQMKLDIMEKYHFDPASPKQCAKFLWDDRNMPVPPIKKGRVNPSTDEESLIWIKDHTLVQDDLEILDEILEWRGATKMVDTFIVGLHKWIEPDGRVHPEWTPHGTDTGRWSCRKPNMQNPPEVVRAQYSCEPGNELFIADYTQVELLVALTMAGDEETAQLVLEGMDIHEMIRSEMDKFHPTTRVRAKVIVFGTIYGLTAAEGARRFRVGVNVVKGWQQIAVNRFPKLLAFREKNEKFFRDHGYIDTFFGRRKYCTTMAQALNHPCQGTAAAITHRAALKLRDKGFHLVMNIHDALVAEEKIGERNIEEFQNIVTTAAPEMRPYWPAKAHVGTSLKDPKRIDSRRGPGAQ